MSDEGQRSTSQIHFEGSNAVMTTIGTVEKPPIRRNVDVGTRVGGGKIWRQSRHRLYLAEIPALLIEGESSHRRVQLINYVGVLATGVKS